MVDIQNTIYFIAFNLTRAVFQPFQQDSFLYWPFLVFALMLALMCWKFRLNHQSMSWSEFRQRHFTSAIWFHPSAWADYRFYFANALIFPALFGGWMGSPAAVSTWLDGALGFSGHGQTNTGIGWYLAYSMFFFIAYDFGRYLAHAAQHFVPVLWEFHSVHHSAEVLTPLTAYRTHPVDLWIMAWGSTLTTGLVSWTFNKLVGGGVDFVTFMGMHALLWLSNLTGNLNHSSVWLSFGPRWGKWLISPAHHQIHHSNLTKHQDRNLGFALAIWDHWFGTLYVPSVEPEICSLGLRGGTPPGWQKVYYLMCSPFLRLGQRLLSACRFKRTDLS